MKITIRVLSRTGTYISLLSEMTTWMLENTSGVREITKRDNSYLYADFHFKDERDALAFKLKFGV